MKLTTELKKAIDHVQGVVALHQKIEAAIATGQGELTASREKLATLIGSLETIEADAALNGSQTKSVATRKQISELRELIESTEARMRGLGIRRKESSIVVDEAFQSFQPKWNVFVNAQLREFAREYDGAVKALEPVVNRGRALLWALNQDGVNLHDSRFYTFDPNKYHEHILDTSATYFENGKHLPMFMRDKDAMAFFDEVNTVAQVFQAVKTTVDAVRERQRAETPMSFAVPTVTSAPIPGEPVVTVIE